MSLKQLTNDYWPLASAIAVGLVAWGTLNADVNKLKEDAATAKTDHDLIVEMRVEQGHIRDDIKDIKESLNANSGRNQSRTR